MPLSDIVEKSASYTAKGCAGGKMLVDKMKSGTWDEKDAISKEEVEEIIKSLTEFTKTKKEFLSKMPGWRKTRQRTINKLYDIASECDSLHKDCNIAHMTGSGFGAVGGLLVIAGLIAAPFTFGTSLSLTTIAGVATGALGAATNITTSIVESSEMKDKCKKVQDCLDDDKRETKALTAVVEHLMGYLETVEKLQEKMEKIGKLEVASIALDGIKLAAKTTSSAIDMAKTVKALPVVRSFTAAEISLLKVFPKMFKGVKAIRGTASLAGKLAPFLAVAGLGISIWEIVTTSIDIDNGSETEAAKKLKENARNLKEQMDTLCEIENKLKAK